MLHISALERLVHELARLPGVGPKTAQRLAYYMLRSPVEYARNLGEALLRIHVEVQTCPICFNYTDQNLCRYCNDEGRSDEILCVVEDPWDITRIESSGVFHGRYHVLHGAISPLDRIGPSDLRTEELFQRVSHGHIREVIMALDTDLEGDTTVLYLARQLAPLGVRVSRIAHGVPIGSDIDYIDDRTMRRALENRKDVVF